MSNLRWVRAGIAAVSVILAAFLASPAGAVSCGCMDVILVVDDTGSMWPSIANTSSGMTDIIAAAEAASGGDVRYALVTFKDLLEVRQDLTSDPIAIRAAIDGLIATGGWNEPEASDQAVQYAVNRASACTTLGALGPWRLGCLKIVVLVTDARPGGCDDAFGPSDLVAAQMAADTAAAAGILVSAVHVNDGYYFAEELPVMLSYASTTNGVYVEVPLDGSGSGAAIQAIIERCGAERNECPDGLGYWKNNVDVWPVDTLTMGGYSYDKAELLSLLAQPVKGDQSLILAKQLIAALLNIAGGADPAPVESVLEQADALLTGQGKLPLGVKDPIFSELSGPLDDYNNRLLTATCTDTRVE